MPAGRPSEYKPEIAEQICQLIADNYRLRQIEQMDGMPARPTIRRWLAQHEEFRIQYARAREELADDMADEILEIADDGRNDWVERQGRGGEIFTALDTEAVMRSKLRCDQRRWLMSKIVPRKYGDKVAITGADDGPLAVRWVGPGDPEPAS